MRTVLNILDMFVALFVMHILATSVFVDRIVAGGYYLLGDPVPGVFVFGGMVAAILSAIYMVFKAHTWRDLSYTSKQFIAGVFGVIIITLALPWVFKGSSFPASILHGLRLGIALFICGFHLYASKGRYSYCMQNVMVAIGASLFCYWAHRYARFDPNFSATVLPTLFWIVVIAVGVAVTLFFLTELHSKIYSVECSYGRLMQGALAWIVVVLLLVWMDSIPEGVFKAGLLLLTTVYMIALQLAVMSEKGAVLDGCARSKALAEFFDKLSKFFHQRYEIHRASSEPIGHSVRS